jgi:carbon-monoxide dehydrogenase medium subunit
MTFQASLAVHRSRKLIRPFRLHRPTRAAEAAAIKQAAGSGAVFLAGGIDVASRMKFGAPVTDVVYLGGVGGLNGIDPGASELRLGSLVTHDLLATSTAVRASLPQLGETWSAVANIRVRCKGTIGGNIMAGDSAYDFALAAGAAGAWLQFVAADGSSATVSARDLDGVDELGLLVAIVFPRTESCRLSFDRSLRPIVSLAIGLDLAGEAITGGRLAIGCSYPQPLVVDIPIVGPSGPPELAAQASGIAEAVAASLPDPIADHNASAGYRRRMIGVLLRRQLSALK